MKKIIHDIISYTGALLFCGGTLGCAFKWTTYFFMPNIPDWYYTVMYMFAAIIGSAFIFSCYHPKKLN